MRWLDRWREDRALRTGARRYVRALLTEVPDDDVRWLARHAAAGDADHAGWELRYGKLAIGYLVAQRDALSDGIPAAVARALTEGLAADARIDAAKRAVAARQLNERLRAMAEHWHRREDPISLPHRLARVLLSFAAGGARASDATEREAAAILARYLAEAAVQLAQSFGVAELSETVPPSAMRRTRAAG